MLARVFEAAGLAATSISLVREHTEQVKPPRALFVPFPFGRPFGRPDDPAFQNRVLAAVLDLFNRPSGPVLEDYPEQDEAIARPPAPERAQVRREGDVAFEVFGLRGYHDQWLSRTGRSAVGLTGIPTTRFRGLVRLLESYLAGEPLELLADKPAVSDNQFLRWAVDDLKAYYLEARLAQQPDATIQELQDWLWTETAGGGLIKRVRDRMDSQDDPAAKAVAFGMVPRGY